ncbi:serum amyloid A-3 protein isoform X1 [Arvicanthis niloticus]|uniref:serum amyloid A-3 protein isoform X1 n=2 Tax=Arvicanthis niloticus TaxID=61156 RepID=UPI00402B5CB3
MGKLYYARCNRDCPISGVTVYIGIPSYISSARDRGHSPGVPAGAHSTSTMKPFIAIIFCFLILGVDSQRWLRFMKEAGQGSRDMWRAYSDMKKANWKNSDKYFHARGNYDAARRGPGGAWAAKVISNARENIQRFTGHGAEDSKADQFANKWGRSGKDPNYFRPAGLPKKY